MDGPTELQTNMKSPTAVCLSVALFWLAGIWKQAEASQDVLTSTPVGAEQDPPAPPMARSSSIRSAGPVSDLIQPRYLTPSAFQTPVLTPSSEHPSPAPGVISKSEINGT